MPVFNEQPSSGDDWLRRVGSATPTGQQIAMFDWAATALGHPGSWRPELRVAVQLCLATRFPTLVLWGAELRMICNEAYREMIGDKHPAIGAPLRDIFSEVWDRIGPLTEAVMESAVASWNVDEMLVLDRHGFPEESQFTYSFAPLHADDDVIGLVHVVTETTLEVRAARRLECLAALVPAMLAASDARAVAAAAVRSLTNGRDDIVYAEVFLRERDELVLAASSRAEGEVPHDDVCVALPLSSGPDGPDGVLEIGLNPLVPVDDEYEDFLHSIAFAVSATLEIVQARSRQLADQREVAEAIQRAMLEPADVNGTEAVRYLPAEARLAAGGDWYDVIDLPGSITAIVVGDCVGHGLDALTTMAQLRTAARTLILQRHSPSEVLTQLDRVAPSIPGAFMTSMACVVVDRARGSLRYAVAGHPPTLLLDGASTTWLEAGRGLPLAVDPGVARQEVEIVHEPDAWLVLYTDGLIERRREPLDVGRARLEQAARECQEMGVDVEQFADHLLARLVPEPPADDVVLVVARLEGAI